MIPQRTLSHPIRCSGIGLHTGRTVELSLRPAPTDAGIIFCRSDLGNDVHIPAQSTSVVDGRLCTTIGTGQASVATIEHLMSAMAGLGIDNAYVDVNGPEVPIMDGSSAPFVFLIQCAGIEEQSKPKKVLRILKTVRLEAGDKRCSLAPASGFKVSYHLDYSHPMLRDRKVSVDFSSQAYTREVSRARTFGFLHEIEALQNMGLALGGSLENAIVFDTHRVINEGGLRYEDECARHKILDTVGDLFLAGYPIVGSFEGVRSGHEMNHTLVDALLSDTSAWVVEELKKAPEAALAGQAVTATT
jgi:UDP-3-O-[3-hydroxymyristoyl] N-acetylglucosamine deacetylase